MTASTTVTASRGTADTSPRTVAASATSAPASQASATASSEGDTRAPRGSARPASRDSYRAFPATVVATRALTPRLRRITLSADQFTDYRRISADDFLALILPGPGAGVHPPAEVTRPAPRTVIDEVHEPRRPALRWYTIRRHRPETGEVDIDIVVHPDDPGPGSAWAQSARVGDRIGIGEGNGIHRRPPGSTGALYVADLAALPALAAILESTHPAAASGPGEVMVSAPGAVAAYGSTLRSATTEVSTTLPASAHIEIDDAANIIDIDTSVPVYWHVRGGREPGCSADDIRTELAERRIDYAWICAEASLVQQIRTLVSTASGLDRDRIAFSGYWIRGRPRN